MIYSPAVQKVQARAAVEARRCGSAKIEPEHLLMAVCRLAYTPKTNDGITGDVSLVKNLFNAAGVRPADLLERVRQSIQQEGESSRSREIGYSERCRRVLEEAESQAKEEEHDVVGIPHLLANLFLLLGKDSPEREALQALGGSWTRLLSQLELSRYIPSEIDSMPSLPVGEAPHWSAGKTILDTYEVKKFDENAPDDAPAIEGGMGQVYRVRHKNWNMDLVVKVPNKQLFQKRGGLKRFVREAEEWVKLGLHPNIVSCFYVRRLGEGGIPGIFAEYVDGGTLNDWIRDGRLYEGGPAEALKRILDIAIQTAWGLGYAHENELIHQDVKPANVMMTSDGVAKVTDFGLARARIAAGELPAGKPDGTMVVTYPGGLTPAYCSPEQATAWGQRKSELGRSPQTKLTQRTDIWSWGLSVLAMFAGRAFWAKPFQGSYSTEHPGVLARMALREYVRRVNPRRRKGDKQDIPTIPRPLAMLLRRCFRKLTDERPQDMAAVADGLREIYSETIGKECPREEPKVAELLADGLNNRAVSMIDLGREKLAREAWEEALHVDPLHLWSHYNYGQSLWARGELTDDTFVGRLKALGATQDTRDYVARMIDRVEIVRGAAETSSPDRPSRQKSPGRAEQTYEVFNTRVHRGNVTGLCFTSDGCVISVGSDGILTILNTSTSKRMTRVASPFHEPISSLSPRQQKGLLAVGGSYGGVWLFDIHKKHFDSSNCPSQHIDSVRAVALAEGGRAVASASWDQTAIVQSVGPNGEQDVFDLPGPGEAVALSSSGGVLSGSWAGGIQVSRGADLRLTGSTASERPESAWVCEMDLLERAGLVLCAYSNGEMCLWDMKASAVTSHATSAPSKQVESCSLAGNGLLGASGGWDCTARIWSFTGEGKKAVCLRTIENGDVPITAVCLSEDGKYLAIGDMFGRVRVWQLGSLADRKAVERIRSIPKELSVPPDYAATRKVVDDLVKAEDEARSRLAGASIAHTLEPLRQWQSEPGRQLDRQLLRAIDKMTQGQPAEGVRNAWPSIPIFCGASVVSVTWKHDGKAVLVGLQNGACLEHDAESGTTLCEYQMPEEATPMAVTYTASDRRVVVADSSNALHVWRRSEPTSCTTAIMGKDRMAALMAVTSGPSPDVIYATGYDQVVWEINCDSASPPRPKEKYTHNLRWSSSLQLSASGRFLVGSCADGAVRLWTLKDDEMLVEFTGCYGWPLDATTAGQDDQWLVCVDDSGMLTWYDWRRSELHGRFTCHDGHPVGVCRLAEGQFVATAGTHGDLTIWNLVNRQSIQLPSTGSGPVSCIAASPDGKRLAVGRTRGILEIWDIDWLWPGETASELLTFLPMERLEARSGRRGEELLEQALKTRILARRAELAEGTLKPAVVSRMTRAIGELNGIARLFRETPRYARLLQSYLCGNLREWYMSLDAAQSLGELDCEDAMMWTIQSMGYDTLHRREEAYDTMRLAAHFGSISATSSLKNLEKEIAADPEDREDQNVPVSWCQELGLPRPKIKFVDWMNAFWSVAILFFIVSCAGLQIFAPTRLLQDSITVSACCAILGGMVFAIHYNATRFRRKRRRCLFSRGGTDGAYRVHRILEVEAGEPSRWRRIATGLMAAAIWAFALLLIFQAGINRPHTERTLTQTLRRGWQDIFEVWWQGAAILVGLLASLLPAFWSKKDRRIISLRPVREHRDAHLFERRGKIVIIDERAIKQVNPELIKHARCPHCKSRILMWYQEFDPLAYYNPAKPACFKKGAPIYMWCKECHYKDYTDL